MFLNNLLLWLDWLEIYFQWLSFKFLNCIFFILNVKIILQLIKKIHFILPHTLNINLFINKCNTLGTIQSLSSTFQCLIFLNIFTFFILLLNLISIFKLNDNFINQIINFFLILLILLIIRLFYTFIFTPDILFLYQLSVSL